MFKNINRRKFLEVSALTGMGSLVASGLLPKLAQAQAVQERKFLFVICAGGGGTLLDSFLPQTNGPAAYPQNGIATPTGSNISCALPISGNSIQGAIALGNGYSLATFLTKHMADVAIMSSEVSSVNHFVAAERAMTGDNTNGGITISEAVAALYGKNCVLPNVNMATGGYGVTGLNKSISEVFHGVSISDPLMFGFSTHGYKGVAGALDVAGMARARSLRGQLEKASKFNQYATASQSASVYLKARESLVADLEKGDYISKMMLANSPELSAYGLSPSPALPRILEKFPNIATDPYEAQMGLAFLLAKNGLSTALTVAPNASPIITSNGSPNSPLAFDWSHVDHRGAQNAMWSYIIKSVDGLIDLLKAEDIDGDPAKGKMWSRSLIYIATEFGRDKVSSGGSGHHLNNGNVLISPMLKGNRVYGGVDAATGLTYGFDPKTGNAEPGRQMKEKDIYSALACALEVPYSNRQDFSGMVKKA